MNHALLAPKATISSEMPGLSLAEFVPTSLRDIGDPQTAIPRIAKTPQLVKEIESALQEVPTSHTFRLGDARNMQGLEPGSVHLVVTSPPYWTLKKYRTCDGQLGEVKGYEDFIAELDRVWESCFTALVPGGRLICVVGDVCLSRR